MYPRFWLLSLKITWTRFYSLVKQNHTVHKLLSGFLQANIMSDWQQFILCAAIQLFLIELNYNMLGGRVLQTRDNVKLATEELSQCQLRWSLDSYTSVRHGHWLWDLLKTVTKSNSLYAWGRRERGEDGQKILDDLRICFISHRSTYRALKHLFYKKKQKVLKW